MKYVDLLSCNRIFCIFLGSLFLGLSIDNPYNLLGILSRFAFFVAGLAIVIILTLDALLRRLAEIRDRLPEPPKK